MELFSKIKSLIDEGSTVSIVIKKNPEGKMTVCTVFTGHKSIDGLAPFVLKGTAEELDALFINELDKPFGTVTSIISNAKEFEKSAQAAAKAATTPAKPASSSKADDEYAKLKAAAEAKKALEDKMLASAKENFDKGNFRTATALYEKVLNSLQDTKRKKEIEGLLSSAKAGIESFFCGDNEEDAKKAVESFGTVKETEEKETETSPATEPETVENDTSEEEPETNDGAEE